MLRSAFLRFHSVRFVSTRIFLSFSLNRRRAQEYRCAVWIAMLLAYYSYQMIRAGRLLGRVAACVFSWIHSLHDRSALNAIPSAGKIARYRGPLTRDPVGVRLQHRALAGINFISFC